MREIALDTETTGFEPPEHRVVEIGCVEMINRVRTGKVFHIYLNPQRDMPEAAFNVHGLSDAFLADKPLFVDIAEELLAFLADARLVIHNADFDMKFLNAELVRAGKSPVATEQAFCTLKEARRKFPGAPASLDALCRRFNIDNAQRTKHGALLDAELLADMYLELMGGAQSMFNLSQASMSSGKEEKDGKRDAISKDVLPPRPHAPSEEELTLHKEFLEKIPSALWKKAGVA